MEPNEKAIHIEVSAPYPDRAERVVIEHVVPVLCAGGACSFRSDALLVVPSQRRVANAINLLMEKSGTGVFGRPAVTLDGFIEVLFKRSGAAGFVLHPAARLAIIEAAICAAAARLRHVSEPARFPGLARKLATLFSEFKQNNIFSAIQLEKSFARAGGDWPSSDKAGDLVLLYGEYIERIKPDNNSLGVRLLDQEDVLGLVRDALCDRGLPGLMPEVRRIVFDGFYDFNPLQESIVREVLCTAPEAVATIELEAGLSQWRKERVFALPHKTLNFYKSCGRNYTVVEVAHPPDLPEAAAVDVGKRLFENSALLSREKPNAAGVAVLAPRDLLDEVVEIARRIKRIAVDEKGLRLTDISVVFPVLSDYLSLVREVFPSYGLPYSVSAGRSLASSPVCAAIADAMSAAQNGFRRTTVFRFLSSPFISEAGNDLPLAHEVDVAAREAGIAGGRGAKDWLLAMQSHAESFLSRARRADDTDEQTAQTQKAASLVQIVDYMRGVFDALEPFAPERTVTPLEFEQTISNFIVRFDMRGNIAAAGSEGLRPEDVRRNAAAIVAFEETLAGFRLGLEFAGGENCKRTIRELSTMLRSELFDAQYFDKRAPRRGVQVMGLLETRGLSFDYVFLGGLTDDAFPRRREPHFFLTGEERRSCGIESIRADATEDRLLFYKLFMMTRRKLFVSWPMWKGGRECVPSAFADELKRHLAVDENSGRIATIPSIAADRRHLYCETDCEEIIGAAKHPDEESGTMFDAAAAVLPHEKLSRILLCKRVEHARRWGDGLDEFRGGLSSPSSLKFISAILSRRRNTISVTKLESYARCPFGFLLSALLGIEPMEEVEEEITAMDRGALLHEILDGFYKARFDPAAGRVVPVGVASDDIASAEKSIHAIALKLLEKYKYEGLMWNSFIDSLLSGLSGYVKKLPGAPPGILKLFIEKESKDLDWCKPRYFESEFKGGASSKSADAMSIQGELLAIETDSGERFFIRGKIDRIDIDAAGRHFVIVDYKTGSPRSGSILARGISEGTDLQLPLYLLMARNEFGSDMEPIGAALYFLSRDKAKFGKGAFFAIKEFQDVKCVGENAINSRARSGFVEKEYFDELLALSHKRAADYVSAMLAGKFKTTSVTDARMCEYCDLRRVCRVGMEQS